MLSRFQESLIPFEVNHIPDSAVIWVNNAELNNKPAHRRLRNKEEFKGRFSYAIQGNHLFENIKFDPNNAKQLLADRYGAGNNGGGVRCGTDSDFQIKGIGKNLLYGEKTDLWHSYGGFSLVESINEAINSVVLQKVLPVGTAKCYGLIYIDDQSAYTPSLSGKHERGRGALLVREACVRPAHFHQSSSYVRAKDYRSQLPTDLFRTRQANKRLASYFNSQTEFTQFIGQYLSNCANQFAFSQAHRISHSCLTSSNIAIDGRWLDLTGASFHPNYMNYQASDKMPSFIEEPLAAYQAIQEMLYSYQKFCRIKLNTVPLQDYYWEQYHAYFEKYALGIIGLDCDSNLNTLGTDKSILSTWLKELSLRPSKPSIELPSGTALDGLFNAVSELIPHMVAGVYTNHCFESTSNHVPAQVKQAVKKLSHQYCHRKFSFKSKKARLVSMVCKAIKPLVYKHIYYRGNVVDMIRTYYRNSETTQFERVISDYDTSTNWIFSLSDADAYILFQNHEMSLSIKPDQWYFTLKTNNTSQRINRCEDVIAILTSMEAKTLSYHGINLKDNLLALIKSIAVIERALSSSTRNSIRVIDEFKRRLHAGKY